MSENIDHEAARAIANKFIECARICDGLVPNGFKSESTLSRAYIDLHAQLDAERARVEALAELVKRTLACLQGSIVAEVFHDELTAILKTQEPTDA